jgi:hypothetical protein
MKSIIVPKNSVPPATETLVIQVTRNEATELLAVCEEYHQITGSKMLASAALSKHLAEFLVWTLNKERK